MLTIEAVADDPDLPFTGWVGENIAAAGYNWAKRDLDDFEVFIDQAVPEVGVRVVDWRDGGFEDYII